MPQPKLSKRERLGFLGALIAMECPISCGSPAARSRLTSFPVNKLCIFGGTMIFSYVGWYAGTLLGFDFFGSFLMSGVGSVLGVWLGWKLAQRLS
jgi:hypothetical protein